MFSWLMNLIPANYSWAVAAKKVSAAAGGVILGFILNSKFGPFIQSHTSPNDLATVQQGVVVASGAVIAALHDWLKVKFPNASWL